MLHSTAFKKEAPFFLTPNGLRSSGGEAITGSGCWWFFPGILYFIFSISCSPCGTRLTFLKALLF